MRRMLCRTFRPNFPSDKNIFSLHKLVLDFLCKLSYDVQDVAKSSGLKKLRKNFEKFEKSS